MKNRRSPMLLLAALLVLGLSGCVKMSITTSFEGDERWSSVVMIEMDQQTFDDMAADVGVDALDLEVMEDDLDDSVNEINDDYGNEGVEASWTSYEPEEEGWIGYRVNISGQGHDLLNEVMFDGQADIRTDADGNVVFSSSSLGSAVGADQFGGEGLDDLSGVAMFGMEIVFALEGARIIEANGSVDEDEPGRVEWVNQSGPYTATVKPAGGLLDLSAIPTWVYVVAGGLCCLSLLVVAIGVAVFFILRSRREEGETASAPAADPGQDEAAAE